MNKNIVIGIAAVAVLGLGGYIVYTKLKKPAVAGATGAAGAVGTAGATGTNANQNNWTSTIGGLFGDLGHIFTGNSTSPTNNTSTGVPVETDNDSSDWDDILGDL